MQDSDCLNVSIEFKCNSDCNYCFIDELKHVSKPISFPVFKKLLPLIKGRYAGIYFCGGEVTLNKQLPEFVSYARDQGYSLIRIYTNGRALSSLRLVEELKSAGATEFLVSFPSADKDLSDKMVKRSGAFSQTVNGLKNLERCGLKVITNTVVTSMNYSDLQGTARFLQQFSNVVEMQFWGYLPMSAEASQLMLPYVLAAPYLNRTIKDVEGYGRKVCVRYFPACLLEDRYKKYLINNQAKLIGMRDEFWESMKACDLRKYSCCKQTACNGLPEIYRNVMPPEKWVPPTLMESMA